MPTARRRRRIRIGLTAAGAAVLMAATGGAAMGWVMGGTTEAISSYKKTAASTLPKSDGGPKMSASATDAGTTTTSAAVSTATPTPEFFPANNTIQWSTSIAPGQALSGVSIRNGDTDTNLIAHLSARGTGGSWIPVASMTVSPGREAIVNPPPGNYAMELVASPVTMPYDRIASLARSPAVRFPLEALPQGSMPRVRFAVSDGRIDRLPDPASSGARKSHAEAPRFVTKRPAIRSEHEEEASDDASPTEMPTASPAGPEPAADASERSEDVVET